ncbi:MAG: PspA/IM30 family protein [Thermoflexibacter sp.]
MGFWKNLVDSFRAFLGYKIEQQEDPVKLTEQSIRELKVDLSESLKSLAEAKAGFIKAKREVELQQKQAEQCEYKATALLEKAKNGQLDSQTADKFALMELGKKEEIMRRVNTSLKGLENYEAMVKKLEDQTRAIKEQIYAWETELNTLKARTKISQATKNLHERLSRFDTNSTANLLESIKEKAIEQEALAESMAYISSGKTSWEMEVDKILGMDKPANNPQLNEALNQLKQNVNSPDYKPIQPQIVQPKDVPPPSNLLSELEKLKSKLKE